ncbi:MAG: hypothetical protein F4X95_03050 [Oligoflexia bacterium]|nr:hypothetical protein [Oligoflexia bacterium]
MVKKEEKFRVNEKIIAEQVRVIDEEGDMMGVMPPSQAIPLAGDKGLDLVEIAPKATPPTCKIMSVSRTRAPRQGRP